ncbi:MAG: hypothetical protein HFG23_07895 [Anaerotruncus sp.]|nr:hypothetical protein [Anaerotruncus sp.]
MQLLASCEKSVNSSIFEQALKFYAIFSKKSRFPKAEPLAALRTASRSEAFRAQPAEGGLLARDERRTLYPEKRFFR